MWKLLERVKIPLGVATAIAVLYLGYVAFSRYSSNQAYEERNKAASGPSDEQKAKFDATYGGTAVKITAFYVREGSIADGESTVLCYGVVNAKTVKIDPAAGDAYPAINRCLDVAPRRDTKYTLTATGNDGQAVTAEASLGVHPDLENGPRVTSFQVTKHSVEQGKHYFTIEWAFANARIVSIDPPVFGTLTDSAPFGKWVVTPDKTTTYTLTVSDAKGRKASKKLTVEVK